MTSLTDEDIRILGFAAPVVLRMLRTREERIISRMYGEFRNGKTDHLSSIAELACIRDQINEINTALVQQNQGDNP